MLKQVLVSLCCFIILINVTNCIIDGKNVRIKDVPYQVSVQLGGQHKCGGAIVDYSTILTAAHCVIKNLWNVASFSVRAGTTIHDEGQEFKVQEIIVHPRYNKSVEFEFDIAILILAYKMQPSTNIQTVVLVKPTTKIKPGKELQISGWGKTEEEMVSTYLKATNVFSMSNEKCGEYFKDVTENMLCAYSDKCYPDRYGYKCSQKFTLGDSGGPLVYGNKILVGIISFGGHECVNRNSPGVYTKISSVYEWISSHLT